MIKLLIPRFSSIIPGNQDIIAEYGGEFYSFADFDKQKLFMRSKLILTIENLGNILSSSFQSNFHLQSLQLMLQVFQ